MKRKRPAADFNVKRMMTENPERLIDLHAEYSWISHEHALITKIHYVL